MARGPCDADPPPSGGPWIKPRCAFFLFGQIIVAVATAAAVVAVVTTVAALPPHRPRPNGVGVGLLHPRCRPSAIAVAFASIALAIAALTAAALTAALASTTLTAALTTTRSAALASTLTAAIATAALASTNLAATLTAARVAAHTSTLTAAVATAAIATATLTAALASTTLATPTSAQRGRRQGRHCRQASSTLAAAHLPSPSLLPLLPLPSPLSPGALAAAALGTLLPDAATSAAARGCGRRWRPREQLLVGVVRSHSPPVCEHSS